MQETRLFIDGHWVPGSGRPLVALNPATEEPLQLVGSASPADVDAAVDAARRAFDSGPWQRISPTERAGLLFELAALVESHADELACLETDNQGQPLGLSHATAVAASAAHFRYYAGWVTKIEGRTTPVSSPDTHHFTRREPFGVCGLIVPWNAPLMILSWKLAPALATGNTVVIKPAEQTPLSAVRLIELAEQVGFPPGVINLVTGGSETGRTISEHPAVDLASFTGSTAVGRRIAIAAANTNLKRVILELGGKAPVIIAADADIDAAVAGSVGGGTINSGQVCAAYTRFYVDKRREQEFVDKVARAAEALVVGSGRDPATQIGPLVSNAHLQHVDSIVREGIDEGAELVAGGARVGDQGFFYRPTVFAGVGDAMAVARKEIFGPVLAVLSYDDDDELEAVIARANDSEYGLAAAIWTQNLSTAHRLVNGIRAGAVFVNQLPIPDMAAPWGGFKSSGWGNEMGPYAIDAYTQTKGVWMYYGH